MGRSRRRILPLPFFFSPSAIWSSISGSESCKVEEFFKSGSATNKINEVIQENLAIVPSTTHNTLLWQITNNLNSLHDIPDDANSPGWTQLPVENQSRLIDICKYDWQNSVSYQLFHCCLPKVILGNLTLGIRYCSIVLPLIMEIKLSIRVHNASGSVIKLTCASNSCLDWKHHQIYWAHYLLSQVMTILILSN